LKNTYRHHAIVLFLLSRRIEVWDTLTYSDIENKAEYSASSTGTTLDTRKIADAKDAGLAPAIGTKASGDADSTTKSAIAEGTIEVRSGNADLANLSRDTANSLNALGQIFDKKTVEEKQELAKLFGEVAFEKIHEISKENKWEEGSPQKIALHAFVGAVMAELGGGDALSGGLSTAINEAMQKELLQMFKGNAALHQWASAVIGAAAAELVGGDAQTGASTAASATRNNLYWEYVDREKALKEAKVPPEKIQEILDVFNSDPLNSYNLGKEAEYENTHNQGLDESGDSKRLNLFIDIAREKGLNDEQISSIVTSFNDQLRAGKVKHIEHAVDAGINLVAGGIMATEIYATIEAGKIVYQLRNVKVGNSTTAGGAGKAVPNLQATDKMRNMSNLHPNYDCSEIADDLYKAAGNKGEILKITPSQKYGDLKVIENGKTTTFDYHQVYSDGTYVFDPRYNNNPILKNDYVKMISDLNGGNINIEMLK
jgi:filamentous hemagglutinin